MSAAYPCKAASGRDHCRLLTPAARTLLRAYAPFSRVLSCKGESIVLGVTSVTPWLPTAH